MNGFVREATIATGRAIPRRTVLRGFGAALALPYLDAMAPAFVRHRTPGPVHRFQTFYVPNGMAMPYWTPASFGAEFELPPILEPLAPFRERMLVLSGLSANWNIAHAGASGSFLTGKYRAAGGTSWKSWPTSPSTSCLPGGWVVTRSWRLSSSRWTRPRTPERARRT